MASGGADGHVPVLMDEAVWRSKAVVDIFTEHNIDDTTERFSESIYCAGFRSFTLYLEIDSTTTPTTLQVKVQFLNPNSGQWHTYKQGLFAALFWEDTDVADGVREMFSGDAAGREMRITLTGVGTTGSAYFTVSASVEFHS